MTRCPLLLTALTTLALCSCYGPKELTIKSTPPGATVRINGAVLPGTTPMVTEVKQSSDLGIVVQKPGYKVASTKIETKPSFWLGLLWTQKDPWARSIEEDEVVMPREKIQTPETYTPATLPPYSGGGGVTSDIFATPARPAISEEAPKLSPMPD